jgi:release factor glutamine methyltransferase
MTSWRELRAEAQRSLSAAGVIPAETEARFLVENASGYGADEWHEIADAPAPERAATRLLAMVDRRTRGEPLQYVMGEWSFRSLDLFVDPRVLIPRPETEYVVEIALEEAERLGLRRTRRRLALVEPEPRALVADLGTGSGAIALALECELPEAEVWATDVSADALAVARANVAGCAATRVRIADAGSWFDALPADLRGRLHLVVSNPPYIAEREAADLPEEVVAYEPRAALVAGPDGTEAVAALLTDAPAWLAPGGVFVCEIAPHQAEAMRALAESLGYATAVVRNDLQGRPRVLVARTG